MTQTWREPPGGCRQLSKKTVVTGSFDSFRDSPSSPRTQPSAAQARLQEHAERLAWLAYVRAVRLQWDEPSPETLIIRNSVYTAWARALFALVAP